MIWTGYNEETNHHIPTKELDFKVELGLRKGLSQLKNPIDFFTLFFNDKFRDDICAYTHMYHLSKHGYLVCILNCYDIHRNNIDFYLSKVSKDL